MRINRKWLKENIKGFKNRRRKVNDRILRRDWEFKERIKDRGIRRKKKEGWERKIKIRNWMDFCVLWLRMNDWKEGWCSSYIGGWESK